MSDKMLDESMSFISPSEMAVKLNLCRNSIYYRIEKLGIKEDYKEEGESFYSMDKYCKIKDFNSRVVFKEVAYFIYESKMNRNGKK